MKKKSTWKKIVVMHAWEEKIGQSTVNGLVVVEFDATDGSIKDVSLMMFTT